MREECGGVVRELMESEVIVERVSNGNTLELGDNGRVVLGWLSGFTA